MQSFLLDALRNEQNIYYSWKRAYLRTFETL